MKLVNRTSIEEEVIASSSDVEEIHDQYKKEISHRKREGFVVVGKRRGAGSCASPDFYEETIMEDPVGGSFHSIQLRP